MTEWEHQDVQILQPLQAEQQIWNLLAQTVPQLQFWHRQGLIYGDIHPAHFSQEPQTQRIALIGSAQPLETFKTAVSNPEYTAPEQLRGQPTPASDLYSLGVSCIYFLTQVSPFFWLGQPDGGKGWLAYVPEPLSLALQTVLAKLTAMDGRDRYQSTDEVIQVLRQAGVAIAPQPLAPEGQQQCIRCLTDKSAVNAVSIHPTQPWVFSGTEDGQVQGWNFNTGQLLGAITAHLKCITALDISPDGRSLVTGSDDKTLKRWQIDPDGTMVNPITLAGHTHAVKAVVFRPDGTSIVSGSWDKTLKVWPIDAHCAENTYWGHRLPISTVAFSPQARWMASGGLDCNILIWDGLKEMSQPIDRITDHVHAITSLVFSPDGTMLVSGSADGILHQWQLSEDRQLQVELGRTLSAHAWSISGLVFSRTGDRLISASWDQTIKIWDFETGKVLTTLTGHTDAVTALALSTNGQTLVSGSRDRTLRVWDVS